MKKCFISEQFGNSATIEESRGYPYKGAAEKQQEFILSCYADYDNGKMYHLSIHETYDEAYSRMMKISCGKWKEITT